jgi:hypothetical protein
VFDNDLWHAKIDCSYEDLFLSSSFFSSGLAVELEAVFFLVKSAIAA